MVLLLLYAVVILCLCLSLIDCSCSISKNDYNSLFAFYNSTNGPIWSVGRREHKWLFPSILSAPCSLPWVGLECSFKCKIINITLSHRNLVGTISSSLGNLAYLQELQLADNSLEGPLPSALGKLSLLQILDLSSNSITGPIPTSLEKLISLRKLDFMTNELVGFIPPFLSNFHYLTMLSLGTNSFSGPIPDTIGNMTKLFWLNLGSNSLSGSIPISLSRLDNLVYLFLNANSFSMSIPSSLSTLTNLSLLYLFSNLLSGKIPTSFESLSLLNELVLYSNSLSGPLPAVLGHLGMLQDFELSSNFLTGNIPSSYGNLTSITTLMLFSNSLTGPIPTSLSCLKSLTTLDLYYNLLSSSIPTSMFTLNSLRTFSLYNNMFTGRLPSVVNSMTSLVLFNLNSNSLTGPIPASLGLIKSLTIVALHSNSFVDSIPSTFGQLSRLQQLSLYDNILTGWLPSSIGYLSRLKWLYLFSNRISGPLPTSLGSLSSLVVLFLDLNYFTGPIPYSLGTMSSLQILGLYGNCLTGSIPSSLGQLSSINSIYLYMNHLSGSFPSSLVNLSNTLEVLLCSTNSLTGPIPTWLSSFLNLSMLLLDSNSLTNSIPDSIGWLQSLSQFGIYANSLTGTIPFSISGLSSMIELAIYSNQLSGPLPTSLGVVTNLQVLLFNDNSLSGKIPSEFGNISRLQEIDANANSFSGNIPASLGFLPNLTVLFLDNNHFNDLTILSGSYSSLTEISLSYNCFSTAILSHFCSITSLKVLFVNEISSNCNSWISMFSMSDNKNWPSCLWQLPQLIIIQGVGNNLGGDINDILSSKSLSYIALDSNRISGQFPHIIRSSSLISLQMSFNRIAGTMGPTPLINESHLNASQNNAIIQAFIQTYSPLSLMSNRLSGTLPPYLSRLPTMNVVSGNIFGCRNFDDSNDINSSSYFCGSSKLEQSLWILVEILIAILVILFLEIFPFFLARITQFLSIFISWDSFLFFAMIDRRVLCYILGLSCLLISIYLGFSRNGSIFSTHSYCYGWSTTIACLHGASVSVIVILAIISSVFLVNIWILHRKPLNKYDNSDYGMWMKTDNQHSTELSETLSSIGLVLIISMAIGVLLVINGAYVYTVSQNTSRSLQLLMSIILTLSKLFFQNIFPNIIFSIFHRFSAEARIVLEIYLNVFIFLVSPLLVTMAMDVNCFYYLIESTPLISVIYEKYVYHCVTIFRLSFSQESCSFSPEVVAGTIHPPWIYSYQCGSSIVQNYAPILLLSYIISSTVTPFVKLILFQLTKTSKYRLMSQFAVFSVLFPHLCRNNISSKNISEENLMSQCSNEPSLLKFRESSLRVMICHLLKHITVALTFGIAVPMILPMVVWSVFVDISLLQIQVSMFVFETTSSTVLLKSSLASSDETEGMLSRNVKHSLSLVGLFWGIILFDFMGDIYGNLIAIIFVIGFEIVFYGVFLWLNWFLYMYISWNESTCAKDNSQNQIELMSL